MSPFPSAHFSFIQFEAIWNNFARLPKAEEESDHWEDDDIGQRKALSCKVRTRCLEEHKATCF